MIFILFLVFFLISKEKKLKNNDTSTKTLTVLESALNFEQS